MTIAKRPFAGGIASLNHNFCISERQIFLRDDLDSSGKPDRVFLPFCPSCRSGNTLAVLPSMDFLEPWRNRDEQSICTVPPDVGKGGMNPRRLSNWLIALTVAAGLFAAPLSVPAMAALQSDSANEMQAMADDMPCCPDQQDQKAKDCGSCAFIALCMLTISLPAPDGAGALVDRTFSRNAFALPDDLLIDGLGERPPDHPPRTIV